MKRDILDYQGIKIGELELPDDTSEEVWESRLAKYAKPPALAEFKSITAVQLRKALVMQGFTLDMIDGGFHQLPEPIKSLALIEWEFSPRFERYNPLADQMAGLLGWTPEQVDELWLNAASL
jgi:hypothetical protein